MSAELMGYLRTKNKSECSACYACQNACPVDAIRLKEDEEGFLYPTIDNNLCIKCGKCHQVCQYEHNIRKNTYEQIAFAGYALSDEILFNSTSGGAFSCIVDAFCDEEYVIFGVAGEKLDAYHSFIQDKTSINLFRKSKYAQSDVGFSYRKVVEFLKANKKVIFSGTPCQIAGLNNFLRNTKYDNLLTVEVICEGIPSPLYLRKYKESKERKGRILEEFRYREKGHSFCGNGKWDFEQQYIITSKNNKTKKEVKDRWFNPFWRIWLNHLMTRPSCYDCKFTTLERVADITLGDLWGVHIYSPEMYNKNKGASLILCNTPKGVEVFKKAMFTMRTKNITIEEALRYQTPLKRNIAMNERRKMFMQDIASNMTYETINKKWSKRISIRLFLSKYVYGNRQKMFIYRIKHFKKMKEGGL